MGLNETPSGERVHIGFFGRRNAGKSSLVNAVTGQELAGFIRYKGNHNRPCQQGNGIASNRTGCHHRYSGF